MTMRSTERKGRSFGLKLVLAGALLTAPGLALADVNTGVAVSILSGSYTSGQGTLT